MMKLAAIILLHDLSRLTCVVEDMGLAYKRYLVASGGVAKISRPLVLLMPAVPCCGRRHA